MTKMKLLEILYTTKIPVEEVEKMYFAQDGVGPKYQVIFLKKISPIKTPDNEYLNFKQVDNGKIISDEQSVDNLFKKLVTDVKK
jgi:hypothetical protein